MNTTATEARPEIDDTATDTGPEHSATYSPEDNKLRIYPAHRLTADEYARVKAAGFAWAPRQELFVAPMWTPGREDIARELCGEIGDEDTSLVERAEERADRFGDYSDNRARDAAAARASVEAIAGRFEFGQPILVGHHSERKARKDAERMQAGMRRAVDAWETAGYWKARAAGALRAAKYKERPEVRARRIKGLEADARKIERETAEATEHARRWAIVGREIAAGSLKALELAKHVANYDHVSRCYPLADFPREAPASQYEGMMSLWSALDGGVITPAQAVQIATEAHERANAQRARWAAHYTGRLEYERAMLAEGGGLVADGVDLQPGGQVLARGEWAVILRVNRKDGRAVSVTVTGRSWGALGVEEIKDYRPATEEAAAAVKAATARAPICNYPSEGCATMTRAQWAEIYTDHKGTREIKATETAAAHRRRSVSGFLGAKYGAPRGEAWGSTWVYISDEKETRPVDPTAPAKPKRKSTARRIAEAAGVDTSASAETGAPEPVAETPPAEDVKPPTIQAVAALVSGWGPDMWNDAEATRTMAAARRLGWVYWPSTSQVQWTEAGAEILRAGLATQRAQARAVLADLTAPTVAETHAEIARRQAQREAREAAQAEGADYAAMRQALKTGQAVQVVSAPQLFPTPPDVAARMVALADVQPGARVLEPSAGTGALLRALRDSEAWEDVGHVWAVEIDHDLTQMLGRTPAGAHTVIRSDFLQVAPDRFGPVDVVLMNPPFKDAADVRHILHARRFLAPGGRLVAICAAGPRQHEALQPLADSWEYLPPGTFEGTNVRAVLLTMRGEA